MSIFLHILSYNVVPIFTMIILGFVLGKKFDLNIFTLSKLNFYLFVPGFIFYNLYTSNLNANMLKVVLFCVLYMTTNDLLSRIISKIRKYDIGMTNAFKNSIMFNNTGNIGLSLVTLIFGSAPYIINGEKPFLSEALGAQIIVLVFMNVTMNTLGFYNAGSATMKAKDSIKKIFSMPSVYVIPLALLLRYLSLDITSTPLWPAIGYLKDGLVAMALLTLGVQLSKTNFDFGNKDVHISVFTRLIIGPMLALGFIYLLDFSRVTAQTLLISYSVPTAVNTALIAVECDNYKDFASQVVVVSTVFSAITLTLAIFMARIIFPA
ncbi:AEC family transporter [Anaerosolibacter sp.]|uniref:AEC family transporter n=1 Tax=Anaerosolibacter sp. TaxID=1872527 RepID=UPI0039EE15D0